MSAQRSMPVSQRALVQHTYAEPLVVEDIPTPHAGPGSAILRVEAAQVVSYHGDVYNGSRQYPYPTPIVTGGFAIERVAAVGPDTTALQPGELVFFDPFIRARDDPGVAVLSGFSDGGHPRGKKLLAGEWRDSTFAQFAKVPLENCLPLEEARLCGSPVYGGLGYTVEQLTWLGMALVGYGGLRSINLQAGETIIVAPATGGFGSAAALVAVAMGARVIAMGRNESILHRLKAIAAPDRIHTVVISGAHNDEVHALRMSPFGSTIDAFLDLSPPAATNSTHLRSAIVALRKGGRVSLMGGQEGDVAFPHRELVFKDIVLKGQWMYDSQTARDMVKLVEAGLLKFDHVEVPGRFGLDQWERAFETAKGSRFDQKIMEELAQLDRAFASKIMYVVGKEQMNIKRGTYLFRLVVLALFFFIRANTRAKIANLRRAMDRVVEVGFVKEI